MPAPQPFADAHVDNRFAVCVDRLLKTEGGFVNRATDRGGPTNFGISLKFLRDYHSDPVVRAAIGRVQPAVEDDVRRLTRDDAIGLYRHFFWDANLCGALPATLDGAVFDQCVNGGGAGLLQVTVNLFYHGKLAVDGNIGQATLTLVARAAADPMVGVSRLLTSYRTGAENRYRDIVRRDKTQMQFLAGWVARARALGDV